MILCLKAYTFKRSLDAGTARDRRNQAWRATVVLSFSWKVLPEDSVPRMASCTSFPARCFSTLPLAHCWLPVTVCETLHKHRGAKKKSLKPSPSTGEAEAGGSWVQTSQRSIDGIPTPKLKSTAESVRTLRAPSLTCSPTAEADL